MKILMALCLLLSLDAYGQEPCAHANQYVQMLPSKTGKKSKEFFSPISLCHQGNKFVLHLALKNWQYTVTKHSLIKSKAMTGYMEDRYECGEDYISIVHTEPAIVKIIHPSASDHEEYGYIFSTKDYPVMKVKR